MSKKISRIVGAVMLIGAIAFVVFALNHPETSWSFPNYIAYILYALYILVMIILFIAPFGRKKSVPPKKNGK